MEKFKISDIQEIFATDVERFHALTQQHISQLLNGASPAQESLDEAVRQCHTLKGLAATVEAWGLACLGADLEKLLELAGSWMNNEREKANGIFEFILDHMQDWYVMNQFTCMDMLPQAWDVYQGLRGIMDERWPGYLPASDSADGINAHYVRLTELEIPEVPQAQPEATPVAETTPDLDVQGATPVAEPTAPPSAPKPLRVVPPSLRRRDGKAATPSTPEPAPIAPEPLPVAIEGRDVQGAPIAHVESAPPTPAAPAAPKPVQVVPPSLRRRDGAPAAPSQAPEQSKTPEAPPIELPVAQTAELPPTPSEVKSPEPTAAAAPATPPILRVAPPALKRRGKKPEPAIETTHAETAAAATPLPVAPAAQPESDAAADVFASLAAQPEPQASPEVAALNATVPEVAQSPSAAAVSGAQDQVSSAGTPPAEFKPTGDTDLLELLAQEVAGYLTELTASLAALAANLADQPQWEHTRRLFHTIKGTAATFGLDAVSAPAKAAEARCLELLADSSQPSAYNEAFELCVQRAATVAKALHLPFDEGALLEALRAAQAQAANAAAAAAAPEPALAALDPEMAGFFINDARDQIAVIEQAVLRWEKGDAATEQVWAAQRGFHTIKGAANSIGLKPVAQAVHEAEAFLEGVAARGAQGSKALFAFLLGAVDQLRHYLADLTRNTASAWRHDWSLALKLLAEPAAAGTTTGRAAEAAKVAAAPVAAVVQAAMAVEVGGDAAHAEGAESHYLRIEASRLYQLMNLIGEMVIDRARLAKKLEQLAGLHRALTERNGALTGSVQSFQQQFEFNLMQQEGTKARGAKRPGSSETANSTGSDVASGAPGPAAAGEFSELEFDRYDQFNVLARSLLEVSHDIEQLNAEVAACLESFAAENAQFAQTSQQLQSKVTSLSLIPVNTLFPRLQRAFRDACNVEHKEADLTLAGGEALLDKVVVDKVYAPLLHLLRNAVAHGIEDAVARDRAKKPARGQVRLAAAQFANQIVIQITDDGAGVNAAAVRQRAIDKGWLPATAPELTPEQVLHFISQPGFSTAAKVTSVSGRGVGLDVVRTEIENLNGSVELKYEPGQGSTWTLRLPLTLAISEAILANLGDVTFAFPLNFIEYGVILDGPTKRGEDGREWYVLEGSGQAPEGDGSDTSHFARDTMVGAELPVLRLSRVLGLPGNEASNKGLIVGVGERRAVVVVDVVLARQEIVIKQLDSVMALHPLLNGATLDPEGRVIPILNLPALLKFAEAQPTAKPSGPAAPAPEAPEAAPRATSKQRVLIVDDSLSVRKVQERFLKDLGCEVTTAKDGLEALERLREAGSNGSEFDFIFTDLEMPRLNGYELISEVRGNPAWAALPLVVISSRGADKYITKAMNLGASTFLNKPFTQEQLRQVLRHFGKPTAVPAAG